MSINRIPRIVIEPSSYLIGDAPLKGAIAASDFDHHPPITVRANDHQHVTTSANGNPLSPFRGDAVARSLGSVEVRKSEITKMKQTLKGEREDAA